MGGPSERSVARSLRQARRTPTHAQPPQPRNTRSVSNLSQVNVSGSAMGNVPKPPARQEWRPKLYKMFGSKMNRYKVIVQYDSMKYVELKVRPQSPPALKCSSRQCRRVVWVLQTPACHSARSPACVAPPKASLLSGALAICTRPSPHAPGHRPADLSSGSQYRQTTHGPCIHTCMYVLGRSRAGRPRQLGA